MSYEATYSSKLDTGMASSMPLFLTNEIFDLIGSIRNGALKSLEKLDGMMKSGLNISDSLMSLNSRLTASFTLQSEQCYSQAETNAKATINNLQNEMHYFIKNNMVLLPEESDILALSKNMLDIGKAVQKSLSPLHKMIVDAYSTYILQAAHNTGWGLIDYTTKDNHQILITQNNEGSVIVYDIEATTLSIDIAGLSDSSCKSKADEIITELKRMGVLCQVSVQREHRRAKGGSLLSLGPNADSVEKVSRIKKSINYCRKVNIGIKHSNNNCAKHKSSSLRERI